MSASRHDDADAGAGVPDESGTGDADILYSQVLAALWENARVARSRLPRPSAQELREVLREAEMLCLDLLEEPE